MKVLRAERICFNWCTREEISNNDSDEMNAKIYLILYKNNEKI